MSSSDPCSVVRIAIALAALKYKPSEQSIASYLLDLHSYFPLANKVNDGREWRTYALDLEKQLTTLKAQRDADQELLSKRTTDVSQVPSSLDEPPPKKKSKKNTTKDRHNPEWSWDQSREDWLRVLSSQYPSSPSLIAVYAALQRALAANTDPSSYASCLADALLRALDTAHVFLFSADSQGSTCSPFKSEHIDSARIALVCPLLMYVLRTVFPALLRIAQDTTQPRRQRRHQQTQTAALAPIDVHTLIDKVVDRLIERIFLYLLRALAPLCSARLAPLLSIPVRTDKDKSKSRATSKGKEKGKESDRDKRTLFDPPKSADARTDVFALIGTLLEALDALLPSPDSRTHTTGGSRIANDVRDRLGLETIHELEALYATSTPPAPRGTQPSPTTPSEPPPSLPLAVPVPSSPHSKSQHPPVARTRPSAASRAARLERLTGTRDERVKALATRDAGWFLASTLSLCIHPASEGTSGGLLREALLDRIGKLVRSVPTFRGCLVSGGQPSSSEAPGIHSSGDAEFAIDPVCENMLLAICERAIIQLAPL